MEEFAATLMAYGITTVNGDRYAGEWLREASRAHGIRYQPADQSKSEYYGALLPLVNAGQVELLDHPRLITQLASLERRTARSGRDSIDHGPGGHDDVANAAAGALVSAQVGRCLVFDSISGFGPRVPRGNHRFLEITNPEHPGYTGRLQRWAGVSSDGAEELPQVPSLVPSRSTDRNLLGQRKLVIRHRHSSD